MFFYKWVIYYGINSDIDVAENLLILDLWRV